VHICWTVMAVQKKLTEDEANHWEPQDGLIWFHFDYTSSAATSWIHKQRHLDSVSKMFLLTEDTRPRVTTINNILLLALRGVNLNPHSDPEDMIGVRVWANESMIITTIRRTLLSITDISNSLEKGDGPRDSSEFIVDLAQRLISRMGPTIESLEEILADLEERIIDTGDPSVRRQLSEIRRESIVLRRYLAPQREAMYRLYEEKLSWFKDKDRMHSREVTDHLLRYIENLDSTREQATVIHEELVSNLSEQLNSRMYVLSVITTIFLPLGFLTGLFGINVGGIPGSESKSAFTVFVLLLAAIVLVVLVLFKKKRWL
jgi:zinc transporter